jgi:hypothetical protein
MAQSTKGLANHHGLVRELNPTENCFLTTLPSIFHNALVGAGSLWPQPNKSWHFFPIRGFYSIYHHHPSQFKTSMFKENMQTNNMPWTKPRCQNSINLYRSHPTFFNSKKNSGTTHTWVKQTILNPLRSFLSLNLN